MPAYLFIHPETEETKEVVQRMTDVHAYVDEKGIEWRRVFTAANFSIDGNINPMSSADFVEKTRDKKNTLGDVMDMAKEASEKRLEKEGRDSVKEKYFDDYAKKRKGKRHLLDPERSRTFGT